MPPSTLYTRRRRAPSPYHQSSSASSTSSATSISQTGQSSVQSPPSAPPSTPTSDALQPTTTIRPGRARRPERPPPAVPFYPDIRRRLRYRNNALALGITGQKNHLIQRLLRHCPRLSSDLCPILCTCENTLEPDNPWLSASWVPLADTDTKTAVHYVPSPNHRHTWVMTPDGLKEAAEVLEAVMKYDMPNSIYQQFTEAAHTLAQIYQGLQAEMRLYSGRYGAGRELHTKWEIHWNKNEQEEKDWKDVKYQEILGNREDVQSARRHVMQTTGMTEEEIVQRARTPSRKRSSSSTAVPTMEVEEQPVTSPPPMRTYYQRPGFANRSGAAADWLSEVFIPNETGTTPAPSEASQMPQTTADSTALIDSVGWMSAEDGASAAAIQYTLQQTLRAPRMTFAQGASPGSQARADDAAIRARNAAVHDNQSAHLSNPSVAIRTPDIMRRSRLANSRQQDLARTYHAAIQERNAAMHNNQRADSTVSPVATTSTILPSSDEQNGTGSTAAGAVNMMWQPRLAAHPQPSLGRPDDAAVSERNAAAHDDQGAHSTASPGVTTSNAAFHYEVQDGRAAAAITIRAVDSMRRARIAADTFQNLTRAADAAVRESDTALLERYRSVLAEEEEQEIRSGGRTLLGRRADRRRANGQRAPPRALDIAVTDYVRQQGRARVNGTVTRLWQRAGRGRSVFNSNTSSETDEDAFWWQGSQ